VTDPAQLTEKIRAALAPCSLGRWPTPLEEASGLGAALGVAELRLKREDRSSERCGGNKVRGLEFLLAGARPGSVVVTVGGTGSTHCLATAVHAARLGCRAVLAQFPQPETRASRLVGAACEAHAALVVRARARATLPLAVIVAWRSARRLGPRRWIPGGGAHPLAVVGHLLAGLELARELAAPPDAILVPVGTGGTTAGLVLAMTALGWRTRVVGVRVAPLVVANRWRTLRLARRAARLLARHGITLRRAAAPLLVDGVGPGYGYPSAVGETARRLAAAHGVELDSTYGAKTLAAIPALAARGFRRLIFWHTFGVPDSLAERPS
jgi:D-cysteine desulfhydrase